MTTSTIQPNPNTHASGTSTPISNEPDVVHDLRMRMRDQSHLAIAVAAMQTLTEVVRKSKASTLMGLEIELKDAVDQLKAFNKSSISLAAGCELFSRYVTRTSLDVPKFEECVAQILARGELFSSMSSKSRSTLAAFVNRFISDGVTILVHGYSRVVMHVLTQAAHNGRRFSVVTTECRPHCDGYRVANELTQLGVPVTLILDSAVAYKMEGIDIVLSGAEGVAESGGIINKTGTLQNAMVAKAMKKPFYVCAECYKFARLFPLNQSDLPESKEEQHPFVECKVGSTFTSTSTCPTPSSSTSSLSSIFDAASAYSLPTSNDLFFIDNPSCDYTPPEFITLLFTDLGVLTPSAVSDELIKLYY